MTSYVIAEVTDDLGVCALVEIVRVMVVVVVVG